MGIPLRLIRTIMSTHKSVTYFIIFTHIFLLLFLFEEVNLFTTMK